MPIQTITSGQIENAQAIVIAECLYTAESETPTVNLFSRFSLGKGQKQITVPKAGQMTAVDLEDGIDLADSQNIGITTTDLTPAEVGLKVILTDRLVTQFSGDVFKVIGRQMGDAVARKKDRDGIALFIALNSGTVYGADNKYLSLPNVQGCIVNIRSKSVPNPIYVIHHPAAAQAVMPRPGAKHHLGNDAAGDARHGVDGRGLRGVSGYRYLVAKEHRCPPGWYPRPGGSAAPPVS